MQTLASVIEEFQPEIERIYSKHGVDISGLKTPKLTKTIDETWLPFGIGDKTTFKPTLKGGKPETAEVAPEPISEVKITAAMQTLDVAGVDINADGVPEILKTRIPGLTDADITEIKRRRKTK